MWSFSNAIVLKDCFSLYLILKNKGDRSKLHNLNQNLMIVCFSKKGFLGELWWWELKK